MKDRSGFWPARRWSVPTAAAPAAAAAFGGTVRERMGASRSAFCSVRLRPPASATLNLVPNADAPGPKRTETPFGWHRLLQTASSVNSLETTRLLKKKDAMSVESGLSTGGLSPPATGRKLG
jgi:hypothetical protein